MEQVARYRLVALLGEGGMGRVHLARTASGRLVAVKTVHEHLAADPQFRERFRRETLAARAVSGPFTAAVLDADPDAVRPWLATEFCAGPTLTETAGALGPLDAGPLAGLGAALAEALASIHRAGLVHRDLKPSNVILTRGGPKVLDFGIARRAADETLTDTGEVIGSPGFIAPELLTADDEPSPAADVFALAALLARMATGRAPFGSGPAHQVLYRTVRGEADLDGAPTDEWRAFLASCLTGDPAERPTVAEVLSWCAQRSPAGAWWEREPVSGLVREHENSVAALVAGDEVEARDERDGDSGNGTMADAATAAPAPAADAHAGAGADPTAVPDSGPDPTPADAIPTPADAAPGPATPATATTTATTPADAVPYRPRPAVPPQDAVPYDRTPGRGPTRRRLLAFGGAALVAGGGVGGAALLRLTEKDDPTGSRRPAPPPGTRWTRGRPLWTRTVGELGHTGRVLRHGSALLITDEAAVTALDAATGAVRWRYPARDVTAVRPLGELVHLLRSGLLFAPELLTLDARTGNRRWSAVPVRPIAARTSDAPDGQSAFFAVDGATTALVTYASDATRWEKRTLGERPWRAYGFDSRTGRARWFHEGTRAAVTGIDAAGGRLAVGLRPPTRSGAPAEEPLFVLRISGATPVRESEIPGGAAYPHAHPGASGTRYYASGGRVVPVDLATRRTAWRRKLDGSPTVTPTAIGGAVYAATPDGVTALDARSGRIRWSRTDIGRLDGDDGSSVEADGPPLVADGTLYASGPQPGGGEKAGEGARWGVHALDPARNRRLWSVPVEADGALRAAAGGGLLHVCVGGTVQTFTGPESA
ncbi:protein kinase [Streptomyces sp. MW-W600-10]|uniref:serine/threonine-protein kinase n=1 Tax=Streptomyces sp. MW-W600-10 TaxID=2829819 RepID=UPI001C475EFB|nr:protein kinase [Streptomyces sp. MW-W600-10]MBV7249044.1 protein kinase [Streptomyces sp. MW-W600-10]